MSGHPNRILLVANTGGHLLQLLALEPAWVDMDRLWVTDTLVRSTHLLDAEDVVYAHGPTPRSIPNLLRNLVLAWRTVRTFEPDVILSTGAALAVPFFIVGRLRRRRLVFVESFTRIDRPGLTGRMVYPITNTYFVQWRGSGPGRRAVYAGSVV